MIAVIADDFTGAGELAGIGLRFGLDVEIQTQVTGSVTAQLLVIDTDSRSAPEGVAIANVQDAARKLMPMPVSWIYKKTDSVLRGHIVAELCAVVEAFDLQSALLLPANPGAGRTLSDGSYFVNGVPLHETDFANDPEYPAMSSDVRTLLHDRPGHVAICKPHSPIPENVIVVGEASGYSDLQYWAHCVTKDMLPAGGAEFFKALLEEEKLPEKTREPFTFENKGRPLLFVSGSASQQSRHFLRKAAQLGLPVCLLPCPALEADKSCLKQWLRAIEAKLAHNDVLIAAIGQPVPGKAVTQSLTGLVAEMVKTIMARRSIAELVIEGGATASCILRTLGWHRFRATDEIVPGTVRMLVMDKSTCVTVKPGSYPLPAEILKS